MKKTKQGVQDLNTKQSNGKSKPAPPHIIQVATGGCITPNCPLCEQPDPRYAR